MQRAHEQAADAAIEAAFKREQALQAGGGEAGAMAALNRLQTAMNEPASQFGWPGSMANFDWAEDPCLWFELPSASQVSVMYDRVQDFYASQQRADEPDGQYPYNVFAADASVCASAHGIRKFGPGGEQDGTWDLCVTPDMVPNRAGGTAGNDACGNGQCVIYAAGVGTDPSFDIQAADELACQVVSLDPTPATVTMMAARRDLPPCLTFKPWGMSNATQVTTMTNSWTRHKTEGGIHMKTMADIMAALHHTAVPVVKLDIEGWEFQVLPQLVHPDLGVEQVLLELHWTVDGDKNTLPRRGARAWLEALLNLYKAGFRVMSKRAGRGLGLQEYMLTRTRRQSVPAQCDESLRRGRR